jgi:dTDP-4-dehydrorhamnose 3,5-epimerase
VSVRDTAIPGVLVVEPAVAADIRGTFMELFQARTLAAHGWSGSFVRSALSHNRQRGTLRGLHFQRPPHADAKLVTCVRGALFDVVADVRPASPTFGRWVGMELTEANQLALFLPEGVAHGFLTLTDEATMLYHLGAYYDRDSSSGVRWDDPALAIAWPGAPVVISEQDRQWDALSR